MRLMLVRHGDAYAGGMGLVAACDVAFAALGANFCLSETRLGLIPATIGPYVIRSMGLNAVVTWPKEDWGMDPTSFAEMRPGAGCTRGARGI